ncbi:MAG: hypothetical protein OXN89_08090 [Bryobacterales bacterium]|nr:hypothetical protein [Bryobacterales bacterium]
MARKLKQVGYLSSYIHSGKFYALRKSAQFDSLGLSSHRDVRFSFRVTLRATARFVVGSSNLGYRRTELDAVLGVRSADAVRLPWRPRIPKPPQPRSSSAFLTRSKDASSAAFSPFSTATAATGLLPHSWD